MSYCSCWKCKTAFKEEDKVVEVQEDIDSGDTRENVVCPYCLGIQLEDGIQNWATYLIIENGERRMLIKAEHARA